ncbi:ribosomal protein S18-alanine N-acetyltransferase [Saccharospirillum sp. HFRX-1]|uniref:ribosomal protein S18-alanine N-acetyltransferase n=1 Tax=unclassified Saccharospirillum TaxID=2633430 RepID=UPI00371F49CC
MQFRPATAADLDALIQLERDCFDSDRISPRSMRRFLKRNSPIFRLAEQDGEILGYGLLLCHKGTSLARLYSLAVSPRAQGQGLGRQLMTQLEQAAETAERRFIRLEVRTDNAAAIHLYQSQGYKIIGKRAGYYEDGGDALCLEKRLHPAHPQPENLPFFSQTTPFTCGPAALMMALHHQDKQRPLNRDEEIQLWREATTVYMTTGLGGTSPFGLAAAAARRGFDVAVWASHLDVPFLSSVRSAHKRDLMTLVHESFLHDCAQLQVELAVKQLTLPDIRRLLDDGWALLVLISTWRLNRNKAPHWVWLVSMDDDHAYLNDPDTDEEYDRRDLDNLFMPVRLDELNALTRYGQQRYRASVMVRRR